MNEIHGRFDVVIIGGGPAGQKAAVQAAKGGKSVLVIERERAVGGECVHRGTIPSKTLRESAVFLSGLKRRTAGVLDLDLSPDIKVESLMRRLGDVLQAFGSLQSDQLGRNGIEVWHGRALFEAPDVVCVRSLGTSKRCVRADVVVIATGSRPRLPDNVAVDHEHILDSDSILSLIYLPRSLTILGAGVIACEFASIFAALGVEVTLVDNHVQPLGFLDPELSEGFVSALEAQGGRYLRGRRIDSVEHDGLATVVTRFDGADAIHSEKVLCALGRVAQLEGMHIEVAGLETTDRGHLAVDENCRTSVPHIYAVGDVIGPPALAASAMEQGRRAMRHALGLNLESRPELVPVGIYTIPEIATVGLTETQAIERHGGAIVGRALFAELARGQINGHTDGLIKLVADAEGRKLLGAQIFGEGATELIHIAQMAILARQDADVFVENIFNFPTMTEGFRIAALAIVQARAKKLAA